MIRQKKIKIKITGTIQTSQAGLCAASGKKKKDSRCCRCFPTIVQHNLLPPSAATIPRVVAETSELQCWVDLLPWI